MTVRYICVLSLENVLMNCSRNRICNVSFPLFSKLSNLLNSYREIFSSREREREIPPWHGFQFQNFHNKTKMRKKYCFASKCLQQNATEDEEDCRRLLVRERVYTE